MKKVVHVEASPRKQRSASIEVAAALLDALRTADADISVDTLEFIGVGDIRTLTVEKTLFGEELDRASRELGKQQARELARDLLCLPGGETRST